MGDREHVPNDQPTVENSTRGRPARRWSKKVGPCGRRRSSRNREHEQVAQPDDGQKKGGPCGRRRSSRNREHEQVAQPSEPDEQERLKKAPARRPSPSQTIVQGPCQEELALGPKAHCSSSLAVENKLKRPARTNPTSSLSVSSSGRKTSSLYRNNTTRTLRPTKNKVKTGPRLKKKKKIKK